MDFFAAQIRLKFCFVVFFFFFFFFFISANGCTWRGPICESHDPLLGISRRIRSSGGLEAFLHESPKLFQPPGPEVEGTPGRGETRIFAAPQLHLLLPFVRLYIILQCTCVSDG